MLDKIYAYLYELWNGISYHVDTYTITDDRTVPETEHTQELRTSLEPNSTINYSRKYNREMSESLERGSNEPFYYDFAHFGLIPVEPKDKVWIYNVSRMQHEIVGHPILSAVTFPAAEEGEDYAVVTSIPRVMRYPKPNIESGVMDIVFEDGRRIAMDLINPDNFGLDQNQDIKNSTSDGTRNLGAKGVFWSLKNPPGKLEVRLAKKRMEMRYKWLLEQAHTVQVTLPRSLKDTITPEHHAAADYMGGTYIWHGQRLSELKILAAEVDAVKHL
jgi:hypothetical protein